MFFVRFVLIKGHLKKNKKKPKKTETPCSTFQFPFYSVVRVTEILNYLFCLKNKLFSQQVSRV